MSLGDIYTVLSGVPCAVNIVISAIVCRDRNVLLLTTIELWVVTIFAWMCVFVGNTFPTEFPLHTVGSIVYLGLFATALCLFMQSYGLKYAETAIGGMLLSLESVFGVIFSIILYHEKITLRMLKDSGNRLVEPFSGLPVAVCSLPVLAPLLSAEECDAVRFPARGDSLPSGFRLVSYQAVGGGGLLAAFRPEKLCLHSGGQIYDCLAWVAVQEGAMADCDGVFNPDMLELRI